MDEIACMEHWGFAAFASLLASKSPQAPDAPDSATTPQYVDTPGWNGRFARSRLYWVAMTSTSAVTAPVPSPRPTTNPIRVVGVLLVLAAFVWGINYLWVGKPVSDALARDSRNNGYTLSAHLHYYADPSTLVLDLTRAEHIAPADLFRGLFTSAQALHESGRSFSQVILARSHREVFRLPGESFEEIGKLYSEGENPVYLIRTLPEKLTTPDGTPAFGTWTGGLLGVVSHQMEDATEAGRKWAAGE